MSRVQYTGKKKRYTIEFDETFPEAMKEAESRIQDIIMEEGGNLGDIEYVKEEN